MGLVGEPQAQEHLSKSVNQSGRERGRGWHLDHAKQHHKLLNMNVNLLCCLANVVQVEDFGGDLVLSTTTNTLA